MKSSIKQPELFEPLVAKLAKGNAAIDSLATAIVAYTGNYRKELEDLGAKPEALEKSLALYNLQNLMFPNSPRNYRTSIADFQKEFSPIHTALSSGKTSQLELALKAGANPTSYNTESAGKFPFLGYALGRNTLKEVHLLLEYGASLLEVDNGHTALETLISKYKDDPKEEILNTVKEFMKRDIEKDAKKVESYKSILEGLDPKIKTEFDLILPGIENSNTLSKIALTEINTMLEKGQSDELVAYFKKMADINSQDEQGNNLLHITLGHVNFSAHLLDPVSTLVDQGVNLFKINSKGEIPILLALNYGKNINEILFNDLLQFTESTAQKTHKEQLTEEQIALLSQKANEVLGTEKTKELFKRLGLKLLIEDKKAEAPTVKITGIPAIEDQVAEDQVREVAKNITYENGDVYIGNFVNGKLEGKGKITYSNGNVFEGNFVDGKMEGEGTITFKNKWLYIANWRDGKPVTEERELDGRKFIGTLKNPEVKVGEIFADFKNGSLIGKCKLVFNIGTTYQGDFINGSLTGKCSLEFQDGSTYEGDYVEGNRNGEGKLKFPNGEVYQGSFDHNKRTGKGKYTFTNGIVYEGDFIDGKMTGRGKRIYPSGDVYEGDFIDGKMTGRGKRIYPNGDVYEGDIVDGIMQGKGKYIFKDSGEFIGEFFNNKPIKGTLTYRDGTVKNIDIELTEALAKKDTDKILDIISKMEILHLKAEFWTIIKAENVEATKALVKSLDEGEFREIIGKINKEELSENTLLMLFESIKERPTLFEPLISKIKEIDKNVLIRKSHKTDNTLINSLANAIISYTGKYTEDLKNLGADEDVIAKAESLYELQAKDIDPKDYVTSIFGFQNLFTPIAEAIRGGNLLKLELALKAGANPQNNSIERCRFSFLSLACDSESLECVRLLLEHGDSLLNGDQETPLEKLIKHYNKDPNNEIVNIVKEFIRQDIKKDGNKLDTYISVMARLSSEGIDTKEFDSLLTIEDLGRLIDYYNKAHRTNDQKASILEIINNLVIDSSNSEKFHEKLASLREKGILSDEPLRQALEKKEAQAPLTSKQWLQLCSLLEASPSVLTLDVDGKSYKAWYNLTHNSMVIQSAAEYDAYTQNEKLGVSIDESGTIISAYIGEKETTDLKELNAYNPVMKALLAAPPLTAKAKPLGGLTLAQILEKPTEYTKEQISETLRNVDAEDPLFSDEKGLLNLFDTIMQSNIQQFEIFDSIVKKLKENHPAIDSLANAIVAYTGESYKKQLVKLGANEGLLEKSLALYKLQKHMYPDDKKMYSTSIESFQKRCFPIFTALNNGNSTQLQLALKAGANPTNHTLEQASNPFLVQAIKGNSLHEVCLLLRYGASFLDKTIDGTTALESLIFQYKEDEILDIVKVFARRDIEKDEGKLTSYNQILNDLRRSKMNTKAFDSILIEITQTLRKPSATAFNNLKNYLADNFVTLGLTTKPDANDSITDLQGKYQILKTAVEKSNIKLLKFALEAGVDLINYRTIEYFSYTLVHFLINKKKLEQIHLLIEFGYPIFNINNDRTDFELLIKFYNDTTSAEEKTKILEIIKNIKIDKSNFEQFLHQLERFQGKKVHFDQKLNSVLENKKEEAQKNKKVVEISSTTTTTIVADPLTQEELLLLTSFLKEAEAKDSQNPTVSISVGGKPYKAWYNPKFESISIQGHQEYMKKANNDKVGISIDDSGKIKSVYVDGQKANPEALTKYNPILKEFLTIIPKPLEIGGIRFDLQEVAAINKIRAPLVDWLKNYFILDSQGYILAPQEGVSLEPLQSLTDAQESEFAKKLYKVSTEGDAAYAEDIRTALMGYNIASNPVHKDAADLLGKTWSTKDLANVRPVSYVKSKSTALGKLEPGMYKKSRPAYIDTWGNAIWKGNKDWRKTHAASPKTPGTKAASPITQQQLMDYSRRVERVRALHKKGMLLGRVANTEEVKDFMGHRYHMKNDILSTTLWPKEKDPLVMQLYSEYGTDTVGLLLDPSRVGNEDFGVGFRKNAFTVNSGFQWHKTRRKTEKNSEYGNSILGSSSLLAQKGLLEALSNEVQSGGSVDNLNVSLSKDGTHYTVTKKDVRKGGVAKKNQKVRWNEQTYYRGIERNFFTGLFVKTDSDSFSKELKRLFELQQRIRETKGIYVPIFQFRGSTNELEELVPDNLLINITGAQGVTPIEKKGSRFSDALGQAGITEKMALDMSKSTARHPKIKALFDLQLLMFNMRNVLGQITIPVTSGKATVFEPIRILDNLHLVFPTIHRTKNAQAKNPDYFFSDQDINTIKTTPALSDYIKKTLTSNMDKFLCISLGKESEVFFHKRGNEFFAQDDPKKADFAKVLARAIQSAVLFNIYGDDTTEIVRKIVKKIRESWPLIGITPSGIDMILGSKEIQTILDKSSLAPNLLCNELESLDAPTGSKKIPVFSHNLDQVDPFNLVTLPKVADLQNYLKELGVNPEGTIDQTILKQFREADPYLLSYETALVQAVRILFVIKENTLANAIITNIRSIYPALGFTAAKEDSFVKSDTLAQWLQEEATGKPHLTEFPFKSKMEAKPVATIRGRYDPGEEEEEDMPVRGRLAMQKQTASPVSNQPKLDAAQLQKQVTKRDLIPAFSPVQKAAASRLGLVNSDGTPLWMVEPEFYEEDKPKKPYIGVLDLLGHNAPHLMTGPAFEKAVLQEDRDTFQLAMDSRLIREEDVPHLVTDTLAVTTEGDKQALRPNGLQYSHSTIVPAGGNIEYNGGNEKHKFRSNDARSFYKTAHRGSYNDADLKAVEDYDKKLLSDKERRLKRAGLLASSYVTVSAEGGYGSERVPLNRAYRVLYVATAGAQFEKYGREPFKYLDGSLDENELEATDFIIKAGADAQTAPLFPDYYANGQIPAHADVQAAQCSKLDDGDFSKSFVQLKDGALFNREAFQRANDRYMLELVIPEITKRTKSQPIYLKAVLLGGGFFADANSAGNLRNEVINTTLKSYIKAINQGLIPKESAIEFPRYGEESTMPKGLLEELKVAAQKQGVHLVWTPQGDVCNFQLQTSMSGTPIDVASFEEKGRLVVLGAADANSWSGNEPSSASVEAAFANNSNLRLVMNWWANPKVLEIAGKPGI